MNETQINEAVLDAVASGLLHQRPAMNPPGVDYESEDILVGIEEPDYTGKRRKVYVGVRLARRDGERITTEHEEVSSVWEIAITGSTRYPCARDIDSGGQIADTVRDLDTPGAVRLAELWGEWHLSGVQAGCAHQKVVYEDGPYGRRPSLDLTPVCPESGYRYGSAWLHRNLPAGVVTEVLGLLRYAREHNGLHAWQPSENEGQEDD